jgi:hypothetical protein
MSIEKLVVPVLLAKLAFAQAAANTPFTEDFNAANVQWKVTSGDGVSMVYNYTSSPGMSFTNENSGLAYASWNAGRTAFFIRARLNISKLWFTSNGGLGSAFALTTAVPGSMSSSDSSIIVGVNRQGLYLQFRSGELAGSGGNYQGALLGGTTIPWPQGSTGASIPTQWNWWFTIQRDNSNHLRWDVYTDQYQGGSAALGTFTLAMLSHTSDYFKYVVADNTAINSSRTSAEIAGILSDFHGYASISGGSAHTVSSIVPGGGSTTLQSGNPVTITGTNFDDTSSYTVAVGAGSNYKTTTATYVDSTTLTATLPTESNAGVPYQFHVVRNNIDAELMSGITYSAAVLDSIVPHEVPLTPVDSADGTVQVYGQGFDNTCTITFGGKPGTVTVVSPTHLSVAVPPGRAGMPRVVLYCDSSTVYDSSDRNTYPPAGKINFGYAPHPYLQFNTSSATANSPLLSALQARATSPEWNSYTSPLTRNIETPPRPDSYCHPGPCWQPSQQQNWWDYCWHYLFFQDAQSQNICQSRIVSQALSYVSWSNTGAGTGDAQYNTFTWAQDACLFYDAFFASLTPAQRAQYLQMIDSVTSTAHYLRATRDFNTVPAGATWNNRIAISNAAAGQCNLAEAFSLTSAAGYTTASPWISTSGTAEATNAVTQLVSTLYSYGNNEWMADGGCVEGPQYCSFGGTYYVLFGRALINTNATLGNSLGDQGMFETNIRNARNYWRATWDGVSPWFSFNDTQPQIYAVPMLADFCDRYSSADLCYLADQLQNDLASADSGYVNQLNFQPSRGLEYAPYSLIWRSSTVGVFQPFDQVSQLTNVSYGALRSSGNEHADFVIGIKGCSNHECGSNQHSEPDQASLVVQAYGDELLIDPGYYVSAPANHSRISLASGFGPPAGTAYIDSTVQYSSGAWNCVTVDATNTYSAVASVLRRNTCMYSNGPLRMAVVLDDVQPSAGGSAITYWQAGYGTSGVSSSGFTVTGRRAKMAVTVFGPESRMSSAAGNLNCADTRVAPSWVYCELQAAGVSYNTVQDAYTASIDQPRITCLAPAPVGFAPMTCSVSYGSGTLTVTLSDGSTVTATIGSGKWVWSSATTP